jgi:CO/xanthine dehydrogenase FAD-binding subunit
MIPAAFDYFAPTTVKEAISLLEKHGDDAKVLAGGHSLLPIMKFRLAQPRVVVDIGRIPGLDGIALGKGKITLGAFATHDAVEHSPVLLEHCPVLPEAAAVIGDMQAKTVTGSKIGISRESRNLEPAHSVEVGSRHGRFFGVAVPDRGGPEAAVIACPHGRRRIAGRAHAGRRPESQMTACWQKGI